MARSGSGGHYLRLTSVRGGGSDPFNAAYSVHCLVKSSVAPSQASLRPCLGIIGDGGAGSQKPQYILNWDHTSAGFPRSIEHRIASGTYSKAQTTTALSANTWYGFGGSYIGGSNLRVWLNGVNEATVAGVALGSNTSVWQSILAQVLSNGALDSGAQFSNGEVAEVGFWNAELTADDFNALAKGFSPMMIRPQNLLSYVALVRETKDLVFGANWTEINAPTVTDHPRVFQ